jgi:hypothetical protein
MFRSMHSRACLRSQFSSERAGAVLLPGLHVTVIVLCS